MIFIFCIATCAASIETFSGHQKKHNFMIVCLSSYNRRHGLFVRLYIHKVHRFCPRLHTMQFHRQNEMHFTLWFWICTICIKLKIQSVNSGKGLNILMKLCHRHLNTPFINKNTYAYCLVFLILNLLLYKVEYQTNIEFTCYSHEICISANCHLQAPGKSFT